MSNDAVAYNDLELWEKKITWALSEAYPHLIAEHPEFANLEKEDLNADANLVLDQEVCLVRFTVDDETYYYHIKITESECEECECGGTIYNTERINLLEYMNARCTP